MNDHHDPVETAFDALRSDTQGLDTMKPLHAVTSRRQGIRGRIAIIGAAAVSVILVLGVVFFQSDDGGDLVAGIDSASDDGSGSDGSASVDPDSLPGSSWTLVSGDGPEGDIPIVDGWPITLTFDDDTLGGTAACNGYGAEYSLDGSNITIGGLGSTDMGCEPQVTASQSAFLGAFPDVRNFAVTGNELVLSGDSTEMLFSRNAPVPIADLVGPIWLLDTLIEGEAASTVQGDPATLVLTEDGAVAGATGCRTFTGEFLVSGNQVNLTTLGAEGDCPSLLRDQDGFIFTVLGDGFTAEIDGQRLTLSSAGSEGLSYRAVTEEELAEIVGTPVPSDAELLVGTSWILTQGEGPSGVIDLVAGSEPTITFTAEGTISGNLSCNRFAAEVSFDGHRVEIGEPVTENPGTCSEPGATAVEEALRAALQDVTEFGLENDGDILLTTGTATELSFEITDSGQGQDAAPPPVGTISVTELLDNRPTGLTTVSGVAIEAGDGWIICEALRTDGFAGCGGRWATTTNFDPDIDQTGQGAWDGTLTDDGRFALSGRDALINQTDDELAITAAFANLSTVGSTVDTSGLGLADTVLIGLGDQLVEERTATQLTNTASWQLDRDGFRARTGPFSVIDHLQRGNELQVVVGPHDHCAAPPAPISDQIAFASHLSLQPTGIDSCLDWFTVDLFFDEAGRVTAVTLDLWEP